MMRLNPSDPLPYYYPAFVKSTKRMELEHALLDIDKAISLEPEQAIFYAMKAQILHNMQDDEIALPLIDKAMKSDPKDIEFLDLKAQILIP
jgi:predicted Zn-dependent protease